jgi:hypothetical protein
MDIENEVLLLAIYKKEENEGIKDILMMLENSKLFTLKEGKRRVKELRKLGFLDEGGISVKGISKAKEVEEKFKL